MSLNEKVNSMQKSFRILDLHDFSQASVPDWSMFLTVIKKMEKRAYRKLEQKRKGLLARSKKSHVETNWERKHNIAHRSRSS